MPPISKAWQFFNKIDKESAVCKKCLNKIKYCGNTSNLMKHLKKHGISVEKELGVSKSK